MKKTRYFAERARQQNILAKLEQTSNERSQEASNLQDQIKRFVIRNKDRNNVSVE